MREECFLCAWKHSHMAIKDEHSSTLIDQYSAVLSTIFSSSSPIDFFLLIARESHNASVSYSTKSVA